VSDTTSAVVEMSEETTRLDEAGAILRDYGINAVLEWPGDLYVYSLDRGPSFGFRVGGSVQFPPVCLEIFHYATESDLSEGTGDDIPFGMPDQVDLPATFTPQDLANVVCRVIATCAFPLPIEDEIERDLREQDEEDAREPQPHGPLCASRVSGECTCGEFEAQNRS